jgi:microcystin-dependent protein
MAVNALWLQNVDYPARIDRAVFDNIWTEGILGSGSFLVAPSSPVGMSVQVAAGVAVVTGDNQVFQGKYLCREQAATLGVSISAAPGSGTRHDLVVLQVRDPNATGPAGDDAIIGVVTGVASGSPVDPAVPASALVLARVRVPSGTGSITAGLIDDLRVESKAAYNTIADNSVSLQMLTTAVQEALVPTGTITAFGGTVAPAGWLLCDGTAYASVTYPALSSLLGAQYNTSGGQASPPAGQFRVPILTGRVPVGRSTGETEFDTMGETGGAKTVTLTEAQSGLVAHSHTVSASGTTSTVSSDHTHSWGGTFATSGQDVDHYHSGTTAAAGTHDHSIDIQGMATQSHAHNASATDSVAAKPNPSTGSSVATAAPINNAGSHTHVFNTNGTSNSHAHTVTVGGNTGGISANHTHTVSVSGTAATVTGANASQAHNNIQPYIVVNYIIKT